MMEYSRDEATALLTENVEAATERLVRGYTCRTHTLNSKVVCYCSPASLTRSGVPPGGCEQKTVNEDLVFVREQTITAQVNVARFYNWDVIQRRAVSLPYVCHAAYFARGTHLTIDTGLHWSPLRAPHRLAKEAAN